MANYEFSIGDEIIATNPQSCCVLYAKYMHGDADDYSTEEICRVEYANALIPWLDFFHKNCADAFYARPGHDFKFEEDEEDRLFPDGKWPMDCHYGDHDMYAAYEKHWVRWFDYYGNEFILNVKCTG